MEESEYVDKLRRAGFKDIGLETTRTYDVRDASGFLAAAGIDFAAIAPQVDGKFTSAFVRAKKPT